MRRATTYHDAPNARDIDHYFDNAGAGPEALEPQRKEGRFGEFLVERRALSRFELLRALQLQDRHPDIRIGECAAALGYLQFGEVETLLEEWAAGATLIVSEPPGRQSAAGV